MNIQFPVTERRALALRLQDAMSEIGFSDYLYAPHLLRLEALITTRTEYQFDLYEEAGTNAETEIKLKRNDAFFLSHIGLALYQAEERSQAVLRTWPDPFAFTTAGAAAELEQVYNGTLQFNTQPVQRLSPLSCQLFRYDPGRIQDADPIAVGAALGGSLWGPTLEQKGLFYIEPSVILSGQDDNYLTLEIPGPSFSNAANDDTYIVIHLFGFKVDQGARAVSAAYQ